MLDTQIQINSVDTGNFYSNHETRLHLLNHKLRMERNRLNELLSKEKELLLNEYHMDENSLKSIIEENDTVEDFVYDKFDGCSVEEQDEIINSLKTKIEKYIFYSDKISKKRKLIKKSKEELLLLLSNKMTANIESNGKHHIRQLNENNVSQKNIISVFESSLTRIISAKADMFTDDFMVVQVYYFDIIKDLIYYGFIYNGEKYKYFTSSAGQIRTKKCVFIKESVWNKHEKTIMCGLTVDTINKKGGCNPNKFLAYLALSNSATDVWDDFDIDKTIVIDDFETEVFGTYDLIDETDYSIKRVSNKIPITHTDGCGMMLPEMGRNRMVRLSWIKGLLGSFDFKKFIEINNCSPIIKDIYGVEHDVIAEDIKIIFTKSQFKMWKYYNSWEQYKEYYKKYNCIAGYTNIEEERIGNASINYQMLQTLTDITDKEIEEIAKKSIKLLNSICDTADNMKRVFGVTPYNTGMTYLQKSIQIYPDLMNDAFMKAHLKELKDSMVKRFKAGKLRIDGKYTFILPDLYAACEYWFLGIKQPKGLLSDKEVYCQLFKNKQKLDCLRSPHLFKEHAVRYNVASNPNRYKKINEWFDTYALYTSSYDLISKILMFDVDGDKSLVVSDDVIIKVAERNMKDIVPLYYNMRKASPTILTNESIYDGLNLAFVGGNIGIYSNNISKIWNSEIFISGTEQEKQEAIDLVKLLCCENNFVIDYAKTLYKPTRPEEVHEKILEFTKNNLPHFFKYAKDKNEGQIVNKTDNIVDKLDMLIVNPRINYKKAGLKKINYRFLMSNSNIKYDLVYDENGKIDKDKTDAMLVKFLDLSKNYFRKMNTNISKRFSAEILINANLRNDLVFSKVIKDTKKELSKFGYSDEKITDILVEFLYHKQNSNRKMLLWLCYGDIIYANICRCKSERYKYIQCRKCGEWFEVLARNNKSCLCDLCKKQK